MSVIQWHTPHGLAVQNEFESLFDAAAAFAPAWIPAVDIAEGENVFTVRMELPGVAREDVRIALQEGILTVKGEKKQAKETGEPGYRRAERSYGSFQRSFSFPSAVRSEGVDASFSEGMLIITLPKAEEAKPKQITITVK